MTQVNRYNTRNDISRCNHLLRINRLMSVKNRALKRDVCLLTEKTTEQAGRLSHSYKALRIIAAASQCFDVTVDDIRSRKRPERIAFARQAAMAYAVRFAAMSTIEVGDIFHRDHSTVCSAIRRVEAMDETNPERRIKLAMMRRMVETM